MRILTIILVIVLCVSISIFSICADYDALAYDNVLTDDDVQTDYLDELSHCELHGFFGILNLQTTLFVLSLVFYPHQSPHLLEDLILRC